MNGSEAAKTTVLPQGRTGGMKVAERPKLALVRKVQVDRSRDALLTDFGKTTLEDRYLLPGESYQDMFARVATAFADDAASNRQIILNETSEFCRHLGAWRANETTGMGESVSKEILDFESSLKAPAVQSRRGHWEEVRSDSENDDDGAGDVASDARKKKSASASTFTILDEEPNLAKGLAGAIKMASTKGYFESKEKEKKGSNLAHLQAKSYTIEDKLKDDDRG